MKTIEQLTGKTKLRYSNDVTSYFNIWCEWLSESYLIPMYAFQTNESLYRWFKNKWKIRIEDTFYKETADYIIAGINDANAYDMILTEIIGRSSSNIIGIYPKPITDKIKVEHFKTLQTND